MKKEISKSVNIKIVSNQSNDGENKETITLTTKGTITSLENGKIRLNYNETKATGYEGSVMNILITENAIYINRTGDYSTGMVIEAGRSHFGHYNTPMGRMNIETRTYKLKNEMSANGGNIYTHYGLYINGSLSSILEMNLTVEPEEEGSK